MLFPEIKIMGVKVTKGVRTHVSSGAVVAKHERGAYKVLVMYRRATKSWHLPKGTQKGKETLEETALREVQEETGLTVELGDYLGKLHSVIERGRKKVPKETHYFLAHPVGGDIGKHDPEHDEVLFLPFREALRHLQDFSSNEEEGKILKKAEHRFA